MTFTLTIDTDAGEYEHTAHLGTDEYVARHLAEEICTKRAPLRGNEIVSVGLYGPHTSGVVCLLDTFDGLHWASQLEDMTTDMA